MNSNNNTTENRNFGSRIKAALQRLLLRRVHPPQAPYNPGPDQNPGNPAFDLNGNFAETEIDIQNLHGTNLAFGNQRTVHIDDSGQARELKRKPSYVVGTGRRISNIEDIGGVCRFCQAQAMLAYQEGRLTLEQAQLESLFDIYSGFQCDLCGCYTCSIHCRPMVTPEGSFDVCCACREAIKKQEKRKKIIGLLLSPFTKSEGNY